MFSERDWRGVDAPAESKTPQRESQLTALPYEDLPNGDQGTKITSVGHGIATNEPAPILQLSAPELKALIESGTAFELVDVRTVEEQAMARIEGARLLDQAYHEALLRLHRDTPLVFQCHHGFRSQQAAEYFRREGFRNLSNLQGGIDAWSLLVDPSVPRY